MTLMLVATVGDRLGWIVRSFPVLLALHLIQGLVLLWLLRAVSRYERQPWGLMVGMFLWGGIAAVAVSVVANTLLLQRLPPLVGLVLGPAIVAPVVEEPAKAGVLAIAFGLSMWYGRRSGHFAMSGLTDGVVYGVSVGFGFAFFENVSYFVEFAAMAGVAAGSEVFLFRTGLFGTQFSVWLMHGVWSALVGAGFGMATWVGTRRARLAFIGTGLALAMVSHALWNGLTQLRLVRRFGLEEVALTMAGRLPTERAQVVQAAAEALLGQTVAVGFSFAIAVAALLVLWVRYQARVVHFELAAEVERDLLRGEELAVILTTRGRLRWYAELLRAGHTELVRVLRRRHDHLLRLGMLLWRQRWTGVGADLADRLRDDIRVLGGLAGRLAETEPPSTLATPAVGP